MTGRGMGGRDIEPVGKGGVAQRGAATDQPRHSDLEVLASLLDDRFRIPGTNFRFGLDGILGLLPGIGDAATALMSGYLIAKAHSHGAPKHLMARMALNAGIDFVVGAVPFVGDLFDFAFKSNRKNVEMLKDHLSQRRDT